MNRRCAVCGATHGDVREWETHGGTRYGMACVGECAALLWESHFVKATKGSDYDYAIVLWQWQRRRAAVEGRVFLLPFPKSPAEVVLERWAASFSEAA